MDQNKYALAEGSILRSADHTFTIRRILGSGGFGITYLATFPTVMAGLKVKASVAIKEHFLRADCDRATDTGTVTYSTPCASRVEGSRRDFIAEARRLKTVSGQHPNIVSVNEVFEANNTAYYVMEYLEGEPLSKYVAQRGALSEQETLCIMRQIIDAVAFLHSNRMTHLDIKPANIMVVTDEEVPHPVLIDFGLSKHYNDDGSATSTINMQGFSDGFAPVEQYLGITTFSPTADVYALAATLFYCLTGKIPPKAIDLTSDYVRENLPKEVSGTTADAITKGLQMIATQRPADARVLMELLDSEFEPVETISPDFQENTDETMFPDLNQTANDEQHDQTVISNPGEPTAIANNDSDKSDKPDYGKHSTNGIGKKLLIFGVAFAVGIGGYFLFTGGTRKAKNDGIELAKREQALNETASEYGYDSDEYRDAEENFVKFREELNNDYSGDVKAQNAFRKGYQEESARHRE